MKCQHETKKRIEGHQEKFQSLSKLDHDQLDLSEYAGGRPPVPAGPGYSGSGCWPASAGKQGGGSGHTGGGYS